MILSKRMTDSSLLPIIPSAGDLEESLNILQSIPLFDRRMLFLEKVDDVY